MLRLGLLVLIAFCEHATSWCEVHSPAHREALHVQCASGLIFFLLSAATNMTTWPGVRCRWQQATGVDLPCYL